MNNDDECALITVTAISLRTSWLVVHASDTHMQECMLPLIKKIFLRTIA